MSAKRDHTEPLVLDTLTIAEPSFKKSPVMSLIKRPYIQFAHDWNENNKQDIFQSQAERKLMLSKLEALEKKKDVIIKVGDTSFNFGNIDAEIKDWADGSYAATVQTILEHQRGLIQAQIKELADELDDEEENNNGGVEEAITG